MFNTRQNFHHSKLPKLGQVVGLPRMYGNRPAIVVAFPLCDNVLPYSIGIHTCFVKRLDNGQVIRIAGHWVADWVILD